MFFSYRAEGNVQDFRNRFTKLPTDTLFQNVDRLMAVGLIQLVSRIVIPILRTTVPAHSIPPAAPSARLNR